MPSLCPPIYVTTHTNLNRTHTKYYHITTPKSLRFHSFKNHIVSINGHLRFHSLENNIVSVNGHYGNRFVPHSTGITSGDKDEDRPRSTGTTSRDGEEDRETNVIVEKLFSKVMEKAVDELPGLIDQPKSFNKLIFIMKLLQTKKKLLVMVSSLIVFVINNIEFVIKPRHGETDFGIKWNFDCKGIQIPLGQNCSLNIAHVYHGMLFLRKQDATIEPFLHVNPLVSKLKGIVTPPLGKIASRSGLIGRRKVVFLYSFSSLVLLALSIILLQKAFV